MSDGDSRTGLERHLEGVRERAREGLRGRGGELRAAADALDAGQDEARATIRRIAHQLRGLGGSIGRGDVSERAGRLEDAIGADATDMAVALGARRLADTCESAPAAPAPAPAPRARSAARPRRALGWRVLVIDDEDATRQLLTLTLRAAGCDPFATDDPEAFLAEATNRRPDLAIVDAMMPATDGLTLHGALRALDGPPVPVVILSAARPEDLGWVLPPDPALRWLRKPFRGGPLLEALQSFLDDVG